VYEIRIKDTCCDVDWLRMSHRFLCSECGGVLLICLMSMGSILDRILLFHPIPPSPIRPKKPRQPKYFHFICSLGILLAFILFVRWNEWNLRKQIDLISWVKNNSIRFGTSLWGFWFVNIRVYYYNPIKITNNKGLGINLKCTNLFEN